MPQRLDQFLPKTTFQLPDGSVFALGSIWDPDTLRQLVLIQFTGAGAPEPSIEFAISPASADMMIEALQKHANEARFISGQTMADYPVLAPRPGVKRPGRRSSRKSPEGSASA